MSGTSSNKKAVPTLVNKAVLLKQHPSNRDALFRLRKTGRCPQQLEEHHTSYRAPKGPLPFHPSSGAFCSAKSVYTPGGILVDQKLLLSNAIS